MKLSRPKKYINPNKKNNLVGFKADDEEFEYLLKQVKKRNTTISNLLRDALNEYLNK